MPLEQDSDSSRSLKLPLCLEMVLFSGWSRLSIIDRSLFGDLCSATVVIWDFERRKKKTYQLELDKKYLITHAVPPTPKTKENKKQTM